MNINLQKLEEILKGIGYPEDKLEKFRTEFIETFFAELGLKMQSILTSEQKENLSQIIQGENVSMKDVAEYLQNLNLDEDVTKYTQEILSEMLNASLEKMLKHASSEEVVLIKQILQS